MSESDKIYALIERRRLELGLTQAQVSQRAFDRNDSSAFQNIKRGSSPSAVKLAALAKALDLEFYFGAPRSKLKTGASGFAEVAVKMLTPSIDGSPEALRMGFLPIPFGDADPSRQGVAPIAIARSWLSDRNLQPDNLYFYMVPGNLMAPTLTKGSLALVNTRADRAGNDIWAYSEGGKLSFARLSWPNSDQLLISSEDHAQPPNLKTVKQARLIRIVGRVIWSGHDIGTIT